jgi:hypothetical protein
VFKFNSLVNMNPREPGVTEWPQFTNLDFVNSAVTKNACLNEADTKAANDH